MTSRARIHKILASKRQEQLNESNPMLDCLKTISNSIKQLSHQIKHIYLAAKQSVQDTKPVNVTYVDERFEKINIVIPDLTLVGNKKLEIQKFMGATCKKVFSMGFSYLKNQVMDCDKVKVFCSEKILENIIKLIKKNQLHEGQIKIINDCLVKKILPYFQAKYPLSEEGANINLSNIITPKNNIDNEENDLIFKSGINFRLKSSKDYSSQIMRFFNYIINESNKQKKQFNKDMQDIFEKIFDRNQIVEMQASENEQVEYDNTATLNKDNPQAKQFVKKEEQEKHIAIEYRQKVKSYTSYRIGMKLPDHVKKFTEKQINQGNLQLTDPSLIRIATKWCEELAKYYDGQTILNREKPYRMRDKSIRFLEKKIMGKLLSDLLAKQYEQYPLKYLKSVEAHSSRSQSEYAASQTPKQLQIFSEEEAIVGDFSVFMFRNCQSYLKGYLNSLIHGIMVATQKFQEIVSCNDYFTTVANIYALGLKLDIEDIQQKQNKSNFLRQQYVDHKIPSLITFKIGDLFRCKCSSKEEQIRALYCYLEKESKNNPDKLKIVRVKNRLEKGTKDILINLLYKQKIVIQMQLAIKSQKHKFIQSSNDFCHYLYELQRAKFGPINQMCSIWTVKDGRSRFYKDIFDQLNYRGIKLMDNSDCEHEKRKLLSSPFRCDSCNYYYLDCFESEGHIQCEQCNQKICFLCRFESMTPEEQIYELNLDKKQDQNIKFIYCKGEQKVQNLLRDLPELCQVININNRSRKRTKIVKYENNKTYLLLQEAKYNKFNLILEINKGDTNNYKHQKLQQFFMENIVLSRNEQKEDSVRERVKKYYLIPQYLKSCYKAEKNSINIVGQNFQCAILQEKGNRKKKYVEKVNISQNNIQDSAQIGIVIDTFPNIKQFTINHNKLTNVPQKISDLKKISVLNMAGNNIETLPPIFGKLKTLKMLTIQQNNLKSLPKQIDGLHLLSTLNLSNNRLTKLPKQFGNLKSLKIINIGSNQLKQFPKQLCELTSLMVLVIYNNSIAEIPKQIEKLKELQVFNISHNKITFLPKQISNLKQLITLNISSNQMIVFDRQILNFRALKELNISHNALTELDEEIYRLHQLSTLNVSSNKLTKLPQQIGDLSSLTTFNISSNSIKYLPDSIGKLNLLTTLNISNNKLSQLPECFNLSSLTNLNQQNNHFSIFPKQLYKLTQLNSLNFSKNRLTQLPAEIGSLKSLTNFNLSGNKIQQIPQKLYYQSNINLHITWENLGQKTKQKLQLKQKQGWKITKQ